MTLAPKRRWFRFSLRTMFVAVTLTCVLLSWGGINLRRIASRERAFLNSGAGGSLLPKSVQPFLWSVIGRCAGTKHGHKYWESLFVPDGFSQSDLVELRSLFPEATIQVRGKQPWMR